jgi:nicotinamidase-related amidase
MGRSVLFCCAGKRFQMRKTALLVIDVQKGLDDPSLGRRNNPYAESNIALLLSEWREHELPIIHIRHCSLEPDSPLRPELPGNEFKEEAQPLPKEKQFSKTVNSAFIGTELEKYLYEQNISSLVIVGLTTDHCVSASTRMAADLGFKVTLISDATAAHEREGYDGVLYSADDIHKINLASLHGEFCIVRSTKDVLKEIA